MTEVIRPPQFDEVAEKIQLEKLKNRLFYERETRRDMEKYSMAQYGSLCILQEKFDKISSDMTLLRSDMHIANDALKSAENRIVSIEKQHTVAMSESVVKLQKKSSELEASEELVTKAVGQKRSSRKLAGVAVVAFIIAQYFDLHLPTLITEFLL